ncbi:MAG: class I SAM-dependent methyltransferase [Gaiellaceae bacterium]
MSADYHDYVISHGRLVGAWDEMYAACDDPWHQTQDARSEGRRTIVAFAKEIDARTILEVGCGLGYFTAELVSAGFDVIGMDASEVAIERAKTLHPELADRFVVGRAEDDLAGFAGVDAAVFAEVTWYVLDHLARILEDLRRHYAGGHLIHLLTFYPPGRQRYGTDFFTTPDELVERFGFEVVASAEAGAQTAGDYASTILFRIP